MEQADVLRIVQDPERLSVLQKLELLDTPPEEIFDRLTRLASKITGSPISLVSLVDQDRQFFKSLFGLPEPLASERETPLSHSFCKHVVATGDPLIVTDAREHPVLKDNLAIPDLNVIAYLGMPLNTSDGDELGSFCIIDTKPREWTPHEVDIARELAISVMTEIELRVQVKAREQAEARLLAQNQAYRTIIQQNKQFVTAINNMTTGAVITDPQQSDNPLIFVNAAFTQMTGYTSEDAVGKNCRFLQGANTNPDAISKIRQAISSQIACTVELLNYRKNGTPFWNELTISPIFDENGIVVNFIGLQTDVTKRKAAEESLIESETRFRTLASATSEGVIIHDHGRILDVNQAIVNMFGYEVDELIGQSALDLTALEYRELALEKISTESEAMYESRGLRKDQTTFDIEVASRHFRDKGRTLRITAVRDLTERKQAAAALKEAEDHLAAVLDHLPAILFVIDINGIFTISRGKGLISLGRQPDEVVGQSIYDLNSDNPLIIENVQAALAGETRTFTGQVGNLFFDAFYEPIRNEASEVIGVAGVTLNVTSRVRSQMALQESESNLRRVLTSISDHVYTLEFAQDATVISNGATSTNIETISGYSLDSFLNDETLWPSLIHPDDESKVAVQIEKFVQGQASEMEYRIRHADGHTVWVRDSGRPQFDPTTESTQVYGVISDVTERKRTEFALFQLQQRLHALYEVALLTNSDVDTQLNTLLQIGIDLLDLEIGIISKVEGTDYIVLHFQPSTAPFSQGQIFELGQTYCDITYKAHNVVDIDHMKESEYESHPCYQQFALEAYIGAPILVNEQRFGTLNLSSSQPRQDPFTQVDKEFISLMSRLVGTTFERLSDRKALAQARDEAIEANQFKTQLLAKVSHELRTPLGAILGYTEVVHDEMFEPITPRQATYLSRVLESTHYLTQLVSELLDQARLDAGQLVLETTPFSPRDLLNEIVIKLQGTAEAKALKLQTVIGPELPQTLVGDPKRLQQILMNLTSNAIKFTEMGGVQVQMDVSDKNCWAIEVSDTGIGIPSKAQALIFEPFHQVDDSPTRTQGGTGLGLSIVKNIVTLMDGEIKLKSAMGEGSTFTVTLPMQLPKERIS